MLPDKLIIFDYSGTLTLEMPLFAQPGNLMRHLKSSGLFDLGVDNTALFWEIINATWMEGSTTGLGYKKVMQARILELFPATARSRKQQAAKAISDFVDAYFSHAGIDRHWQPLLEKLSGNKSVTVIIATDHYAEASATIIKNLAAWNIKAVPVLKAGGGNYIVANSADLGAHKSDLQFWEIVREVLPFVYRRVLLIDDFGQNEQAGDIYGTAAKINERREKTTRILQSVFTAEVQDFSFIAQGNSLSLLIAETSAIIDQFVIK